MIMCLLPLLLLLLLGDMLLHLVGVGRLVCRCSPSWVGATGRRVENEDEAHGTLAVHYGLAQVNRPGECHAWVVHVFPPPFLAHVHIDSKELMHDQLVLRGPRTVCPL